ncbi:MAG: TlpA family protein disulfide reductase [Aridibacter famidurans]|nr:TlpA family protein disulfide reductase [Aridibacter famidurans]
MRSRHVLLVAIIVLAIWPFSACEQGSGSRDRVSEYPPAPEAIRNASVELIDGSTYRLADQQGKVVLINLWATWCGPCRNEMPELVKLQNKYGPQGFEVVGLDVDPEPLEMIKPFAEKMGINYKLGWANEDLVTEFFNITERNGIPQTFLINRNGELTGVFFGGGHETIEKMKETVAKVVEGTD